MTYTLARGQGPHNLGVRPTQMQEEIDLMVRHVAEKSEQMARLQKDLRLQDFESIISYVHSKGLENLFVNRLLDKIDGTEVNNYVAYQILSVACSVFQTEQRIRVQTFTIAKFLSVILAVFDGLPDDLKDVYIRVLNALASVSFDTLITQLVEICRIRLQTPETADARTLCQIISYLELDAAQLSLCLGELWVLILEVSGPGYVPDGRESPSVGLVGRMCPSAGYCRTSEEFEYLLKQPSSLEVCLEEPTVQSTVNQETLGRIAQHREPLGFNRQEILCFLLRIAASFVQAWAYSHPEQVERLEKEAKRIKNATCSALLGAHFAAAVELPLFELFWLALHDSKSLDGLLGDFAWLLLVDFQPCNFHSSLAAPMQFLRRLWLQTQEANADDIIRKLEAQTTPMLKPCEISQLFPELKDTDLLRALTIISAYPTTHCQRNLPEVKGGATAQKFAGFSPEFTKAALQSQTYAACLAPEARVILETVRHAVPYAAGPRLGLQEITRALAEDPHATLYELLQKRADPFMFAAEQRLNDLLRGDVVPTIFAAIAFQAQLGCFTHPHTRNLASKHSITEIIEHARIPFTVLLQAAIQMVLTEGLVAVRLPEVGNFKVPGHCVNKFQLHAKKQCVQPSVLQMDEIVGATLEKQRGHAGSNTLLLVVLDTALRRQDVLWEVEYVRYDAMLFGLFQIVLQNAIALQSKPIDRPAQRNGQLASTLIEEVVRGELFDAMPQEQAQSFFVTLTGALAHVFSHVDVLLLKDPAFYSHVDLLCRLTNAAILHATRHGFQTQSHEETREIMEANLEQLCIAFFNLAAKVSQYSVYETDLQQNQPLVNMMYCFVRLAELFRPAFPGHAFCTNYRQFALVTAMVDQENARQRDHSGFLKALTQLAGEFDGPGIKLALFHSIWNILLPSLTVVNPEYSSYNTIMHMCGQFFTPQKLKLLEHPCCSDLLTILGAFHTSFNKLQHHLGVQFFKSSLEIICCCSKQLPNIKRLVTASIASRLISYEMAYTVSQIGDKQKKKEEKNAPKKEVHVPDISGLFVQEPAIKKLIVNMGEADAINRLVFGKEFSLPVQETIDPRLDSKVSITKLTTKVSNFFVPTQPLHIVHQIANQFVILLLGIALDWAESCGQNVNQLTSYLQQDLLKSAEATLGIPSLLVNLLSLCAEVYVVSPRGLEPQQGKAGIARQLYLQTALHSLIKSLGLCLEEHNKARLRSLAYGQLISLTDLNQENQGLETAIKVLGERSVSRLLHSTMEARAEQTSVQGGEYAQYKTDAEPEGLQAQLGKLNTQTAAEFVVKRYRISLFMHLVEQCHGVPVQFQSQGQQILELLDLAQTFYMDKQELEGAIAIYCRQLSLGLDEQAIKQLQVFTDLRNTTLEQVDPFSNPILAYCQGFATQSFERVELGLMYLQALRMIGSLLQSQPGDSFITQEERIILMNKLLGKVTTPSNDYEYAESIAAVTCIQSLLEKTELYQVFTDINTEKQLLQQEQEEHKYFQLLMRQLLHLLQEALDSAPQASAENSKNLSQYIAAIQRALQTLMRYYFNNNHLQKLIQYAFSEQKILRESYLQIIQQHSNDMAQRATKLDGALNLKFLLMDAGLLKQKCARLFPDIVGAGVAPAFEPLGTEQAQQEQNKTETNLFSTLLTTHLELFADRQSFPYPKQYLFLLCLCTMDPQMGFISALQQLVSVAESDKLTTAIYNVFSYTDKMLRQKLLYTELDYQMPRTHQMYIILRNAMQYEINNTATPETVLRQNSIATKLMQQYIRLMGGVEFLHKFCRPIIGMCIQTESTQFPAELVTELQLQTVYSHLSGLDYNDFELDPDSLKKLLATLPLSKERKREMLYCMLRHNIKQITQTAQRVFNFIFRNFASLPEAAFHIASMILCLIQDKFPNNRIVIRSAVSGFCFLRFICPAIVSPDSEVYRIIDESMEISLSTNELAQETSLKQVILPTTLTKAHRRRLVLVAKVLQNLANGVLFGTKEHFMLPLNQLLQANFDSRNLFLDALAANAYDTVVPQNHETLTTDDDTINRIIAADEESSQSDEPQETEQVVHQSSIASPIDLFNVPCGDPISARQTIQNSQTLSAVGSTLIQFQESNQKQDQPTKTYQALMCMNGLEALLEVINKNIMKVEGLIQDPELLYYPAQDYALVLHDFVVNPPRKKMNLRIQGRLKLDGKTVQCAAQLKLYLHQLNKLRAEKARLVQRLEQSDVVFQYGESRQFKSVIYMIAQRVNCTNFTQGQVGDSYSMFLLFLYIISVIYPHLSKGFDIVVDFTGASLFNTVCLLTIIFKIAGYLSQDVRDNLNRIYVLHANVNTRLVLQNILDQQAQAKSFFDEIKSRVLLVDAVKTLEQHIEDVSIALPLETTRFMESIQAVYPGVTFLGGLAGKIGPTKGLIVQNASGIVLMYTQSAIVPLAPKPGQPKQTEKQFQEYTSLDFVPYTRLRIYSEQQQLAHREGDATFTIIESQQALNSFATLSEQNVAGFITEAWRAVENDYYKATEFGIVEAYPGKLLITASVVGRQLGTMLISLNRMLQANSSAHPDEAKLDVEYTILQETQQKISLKHLKKYAAISHGIHPIYVLAIALVDIYQPDIEFRRVAFQCLENAFQSFMSIHLGRNAAYFDTNQASQIAYLSKYGFHRITRRVLQTIDELTPELQPQLILALMSVVPYVNQRDVVLFLVEQLLLKEDGQVKEFVVSASTSEQVQLINSLITFIIKYPEISDQSISLLKALTRGERHRGFTMRAFQTCLGLLRSGGYESHSIIYILNSFSLQSTEIQLTSVTFFAAALFHEVFCKPVRACKQYGKAFSTGKVLLDQETLNRIQFQPAGQADFHIAEQLKIIVDVLQQEQQNEIQPHTNLMLLLASDYLDVMCLQRESQLEKRICKELVTADQNCADVVAFICECCLRSHELFTASEPQAFYLHLLDVFLRQDLIELTPYSTSLLLEKLVHSGQALVKAKSKTTALRSYAKTFHSLTKIFLHTSQQQETIPHLFLFTACGLEAMRELSSGALWGAGGSEATCLSELASVCLRLFIRTLVSSPDLAVKTQEILQKTTLKEHALGRLFRSGFYPLVIRVLYLHASDVAAADIAELERYPRLESVTQLLFLAQGVAKKPQVEGIQPVLALLYTALGDSRYDEKLIIRILTLLSECSPGKLPPLFWEKLSILKSADVSDQLVNAFVALQASTIGGQPVELEWNIAQMMQKTDRAPEKAAEEFVAFVNTILSLFQRQLTSQ